MHAVVIGGSMSGLLAASARTSSYARVTVIDRDELPAGHVHRRAVPQSRHVHGLLPSGRAMIDSLLPGLGDELVASGAPTCDVLEQLRWILNGFELARASTGLRAVLSSRHARRRSDVLVSARPSSRAGLPASPRRTTVMKDDSTTAAAVCPPRAEHSVLFRATASTRGGRRAVSRDRLGHPPRGLVFRHALW